MIILQLLDILCPQIIWNILINLISYQNINKVTKKVNPQTVSLKLLDDTRYGIEFGFNSLPLAFNSSTHYAMLTFCRLCQFLDEVILFLHSYLTGRTWWFSISHDFWRSKSVLYIAVTNFNVEVMKYSLIKIIRMKYSLGKLIWIC